MNEKTIFYSKDFYHFRDWINLNIEGLTWQGKYKAEFEEFWRMFFIDGLSLNQMMERFSYAIKMVKIGPLISWFEWLQDKLLSFSFVYKGLTIEQLSLETSIEYPLLANTLRNFFMGKFPHLDDYFSEKFQMGNIASTNLELTFSYLAKEVVLPSSFSGSVDDEIMSSLEVTLYQEWNELLSHLNKNIFHHNMDFLEMREKASFKDQWRIFFEVILLSSTALGLIYLTKNANLWYEKHLADKISVYETKFSWLDKSKTFKKMEAPNIGQKLKIPRRDFEKIEEKLNLQDLPASELFLTESEVVLSSWNSLPKDFDVTSLEKSIYEEKRKAEYRDYRFGNNTVYRIMMKSIDLENSRKNLNLLLNRYRAEQGDHVRPGTYVPGGVYYNLFIPREVLKRFLAQVMDIEDSTLYESRTRGANPPGKNKVFIWIKGP